MQNERPPFAFAGPLLAQLAGLSELAPARVFVGAVVVAASATAVFCQTNLGNGMGGAVLGIYFYLDSEDYQTSPVSLVKLAAQSGGSNTSSGSAIAGSPWPLQLGRDRNPFYFPNPFSVSWGQSFAAGLQVTNNESVPLYAEGILVVSAWPAEARREAEIALDARDGSNVFGGAGKVFTR